MKEIWKSIKNHPNYQVSNIGRIRSIDHLRKSMIPLNGDLHKRIEGAVKTKGRIRKLFYDSRNRPRIDIDKKKYFVSNLVASHFLVKPDGDNIVVNHIDNDPENNNVHNLEWCSQKENIQHSLKQNRHSLSLRWGKDLETTKINKEKLSIKMKEIWRIRKNKTHF